MHDAINSGDKKVGERGCSYKAGYTNLKTMALIIRFPSCFVAIEGCDHVNEKNSPNIKSDDDYIYLFTKIKLLTAVYSMKIV